MASRRMIFLNIKTPGEIHDMRIRINQNSYVYTLKQILAKSNNWELLKVKLLLKGLILENKKKLSESKVNNNSLIYAFESEKPDKEDDKPSEKELKEVTYIQAKNRTEPQSRQQQGNSEEEGKQNGNEGVFRNFCFPGMGGMPNQHQIKQLLGDPNTRNMINHMIQNEEMLKQILSMTPKFQKQLEKVPYLKGLVENPQMILRLINSPESDADKKFFWDLIKGLMNKKKEKNEENVLESHAPQEPEPNFEEEMLKMIDMGFPNRSKIEKALRETNGNVDEAVDKYWTY